MSAEFDARKLQQLANRIQIFYLDKKGTITATCQGIWAINTNKEIHFFELFEAFTPHREAIDFLFQEKKQNKEKETIQEQKKLSIHQLEILFEEETFFVDVLFTKKEKQDHKDFLECLIEDKTEYYQTLKNAEDNNKLQEIEFLNEKWQLTKDKEVLEVSHQEELTALNEQLRLDWTNLLSESLKNITTQSFIQADIQSEKADNFKNLLELSNAFEKISGICLIPKKIEPFLSLKNRFSYIGKNEVHEQLIQTTIELAGGKFIVFETKDNSKNDLKFDFSEIDFIFIEQDFITEEIQNKNTFCLLVEPTFLEKKQHLINSQTNLLIYPLYPFQIWQQLLSFTNTTTMSYNEKIDLSQIYEIVDNEPMLVQNMLQILDKNLREYPSQLQREFNNGELDTLRQTVHKFKSCTAYTGLTKFNTTLSEIEASRENGWTIAQIKEKLEFVLQAIPVIKVQVEAKLKELEKELS